MFVEIRESIKQNVRILIADDVEINRVMIRAMYESEGFTQIKEAVDGKSVLEIVEAWQPDLLLLDLVMPLIDGAEVCRKISKFELEKKPIIIVQTALEDKHHKTMLFELGVSDYVVKPLDKKELILRSYVHLENRVLMASLKEYNSKMKEEIVQAAAVQQELLPADEYIKECNLLYGVDISSLHRSSLEVGGDIWGLKKINKTKFAIFIADIAGHGVKAALSAARLDALIRDTNQCEDPALFMSKINERLYHMFPRGCYSTMLYVVFDIEANTMKYTPAGTYPPLVIQAGKMQELTAAGLPIGIEKNVSYETHEVEFNKNTRCLLYSDGLVDSDCPLEIEAAAEIAGRANLKAHEVIKTMQSKIFSGGEHLRLEDDLTLVFISKNQ